MRNSSHNVKKFLLSILVVVILKILLLRIFQKVLISWIKQYTLIQDLMSSIKELSKLRQFLMLLLQPHKLHKTKKAVVERKTPRSQLLLRKMLVPRRVFT
jgi:hypothetical protein